MIGFKTTPPERRTPPLERLPAANRTGRNPPSKRRKGAVGAAASREWIEDDRNCVQFAADSRSNELTP
jgi:hypothetical protein